MSLVLNDLLGAYNTFDTFVIHRTVLFIILSFQSLFVAPMYSPIFDINFSIAAVEIISISPVGIKKTI